MVRTVVVQHMCQIKTLLSRRTPLFRVMNPHPTSASNSSEMPSLISVRVIRFLFEITDLIPSCNSGHTVYLRSRSKIVSWSPNHVKGRFLKFSSVIYFMFLTCFCHGYRVQWCRIPPLLPSVCGLDYMNFFCLNPRNFQLAYRGMPLNSRTGKNRSMCWRSRRDDPLDNTGLILSRQRYRSIFIFFLNLDVLLRL